MRQEEINALVSKQKSYFQTGATLNVSARINALKKLKATVLKYENEIYAALKADLGKGSVESYMCEVGFTLGELSYMIKHTRRFAADKTVYTPLMHFASRSYIQHAPYGTVLIMSPWNYPFMLTMEPLVDALAAGNTVVVKPSAYSPNTSDIIKKIIEETFDPEYVAVVTGGREENNSLLNESFDYIFFTGSQAVGRMVMSHAAEHLTPVTLELGGKSPCIVDSSANLKLAARRIVFGKYLNCGQTCVAPDYLYCAEDVKDALLAEISKEIKRQFGEDALQNNDYGKIINEKHFERLSGLMQSGDIVYGGRTNADTLQIEPTVIDHVTWESPVMQEEIFGPLLPVLTFKNIEDVVAIIESKPHPLALYIFSSKKKTIKYVTEHCRYGGGCVNDTIVHIATSKMPFGGVGASGMGGYHGKFGFETFSHKKSILDKKTWLDLPMRYQPYTKLYDKMIRMFLK